MAFAGAERVLHFRFLVWGAHFTHTYNTHAQGYHAAVL